jgi:hypothetical protein
MHIQRAAQEAGQPPMRRTLPDASYLQACFVYDPHTGALNWRQRPATHFNSLVEWNRWNVRYAGAKCGWVARPHDRPHIQVSLDGMIYPAHALIWRMGTGEQPKEIDHRDRGGLNNRWNNLRAATHQQNSCNRVRKRTCDLPKGVYARGRNFIASICYKGVSRYLGTFTSAELAHEAYCCAAAEVQGEFACFGAQE